MSTLPALAAGRIGPNAVTRVAEVLRERGGAARARQVFARAGLAHYVAVPPTAMIDEDEVIRLHRALRELLGAAPAREVAREAGERTADYVLAHRIPAPVRQLLRALPAPLAARLLLRAIARHAWTFSGSGRFAALAGRPLRVTIEGNPLCRGLTADTPQCVYYAATFERLFQRLVSRDTRVVEVACEATGAAACVFEIRWDRAGPA
jgi:divinyl protochlorophyllide a 8-vinyl-reductase